MRRFSVVLAAIALGACAPAGLRAQEPLVLGPFAGSLPCADCAGVPAVLTLTRKAQGWAEGSYRLEERKASGSVVSVGDWTTLRGDAADEDAVVYQLDPDTRATSRYFKKVGEDSVRLLDGDLKEIAGGKPTTLSLAR